jgi:catechol 2,3-dioxygenase-like lactoylglutathione lyase family enzyme
VIDRIDHFVLTVRSIADTCAFYGRALGFEVVRFGEGRIALGFGPHKINLHEVGREFEPKARVPTSGSADFCVTTTEPVEALAERLRGLGIAIEEGPVPRTGARARLRSIYLRDPDGNLVEIANEVPG